MTKSALTIWCNNYFPEASRAEKAMLVEGAGGDRLVMFEPKDNGRAGASREALNQADVAFGAPDPGAVMGAPKLRWVHLNSAGYTPYDRDDVRQNFSERGAMLTNSSAVYDEPCAQHLLAMITGLARQLPAALDDQRGSRTWPMDIVRANSRLLNEQTMLILGFGAIARRLAELLAPLRMNLIGVRRHVRGDEPIHVIEESRAEEYFPRADHVVNILPANDGTNKFFNAERLSLMRVGAILYNIGRGTTLDQDALIANLRTGRLAAAYLDVTDPEPLPPEHPLWTTPNCYITPHSAGGHSDEKERQVKHFLDNLRRFRAGEDLINRVM